MVRLYIVEQSALQSGGHYHAYTSCIADAAHSLGLDAIILANRQLKPDSFDRSRKLVPTFTHTWTEADTAGVTGWGPGNIAYELDAALRASGASPADHVFMHTLGYCELEAMLAYLTNRLPGDNLPFVHLLLRYDPEILADQISRYSPYLDRIIASSFLRTKIIFHSDTDLLAREFSTLTMLPFQTAPIPFRQETLANHLQARRRRSAADPLVVAYLGDAREEKGYQHLPAALSYLWPDYIARRKLRFVVQSNLNIPGGEAGIMHAAQDLSRFPGTTLLHAPLSAEEYYRVLADADIVLLPYSPERYRYRSSGILIEAMAAGKVIVTSAGSWLASQVSPDHAVLFTDPHAIGRAVADSADSFELLSRGARKRMQRVRENATGSKTVQHLIDCANTLSTRPAGPSVLLIMDGDAMVLSNGAARVAESQLTYLTAAGYRVVALFLTCDANKDDAAFSAWRQALRDRLAPYAVERVFLAGPGKWRLDADRIEAARKARNETAISIRSDLDFTALFDFGSDLTTYLRSHRIDAILLNYITNFPVLDTLGLTHPPVICEMHDICSFQKAIYGKRPLTEADLDEEFALLDRCNALISLNPRETALVRERLSTAYIETTGVLLPPAPEAIVSLAGAKDLADIVGSCGPRLPGYRIETATQPNRSDEIRRLRETASLDLLFVSSAHLANYSGIMWFLNEVYEPFLAAAGVSMVIAGSICRISDTWPAHPNLFLIDQVEDLAPLYAAARIVVLPIIEGAGSPVKTFEALSHGCPIVATSNALRGFGASTERLIVRDDPNGFAAAIWSLLQSEDRRRRAADEAVRTCGSQMDVGEYFRIMDRLFARVLPDAAPAALPPAADIKPRAAPLDWASLVQPANRLIRNFIDGEALEAAALAVLARQRWTDVEPAVTRIADALLVRRNAPILKTGRRIAAAAERFRRLQSVETLLVAIRTALNDYAETRPAADVIRAVVPDGLAIRLCFVPWPGGVSGSVTVNAVPVPTQQGTLPAFDGAVVAAVAPASAGGLRVVEARVTASPPSRRRGLKMAMLCQDVPVRQDLTLLGQTAFAGDWLFASRRTDQAELPAEATGVVLLPRLAAAGATCVADFVFSLYPRGADAGVSFAVGDEPADASRLDERGCAVIRLRLPARLPGVNFGHVPVSITNNQQADSLRLASIQVSLIFGDAALGQSVAACMRRETFVVSQIGHAALAREAVMHILRGVPPADRGRDALAVLARVDGGGDLLDVITQALSTHDAGRGGNVAATVRCCIEDIAALTGQGSAAACGCIVSPALSAVLLGPRDVVISHWQSASHITPKRSWRLGVPSPAFTGKIRIALQGDFNQLEHPGSVEITGFFGIERNGRDQCFRWTGPGNVSTIRLPLVLVQPARLVLTLGNLGANQTAADFRITRDGMAVDHELKTGHGEPLLIAHLPAVDQAFAAVTIGVRVAKVHLPAGDSRSLGIAINSLWLEIDVRAAEPGVAESDATVVETVRSVIDIATKAARHGRRSKMPAASDRRSGQSAEML